jgi:hypothetical protein
VGDSISGDEIKQRRGLFRFRDERVQRRVVAI